MFVNIIFWYHLSIDLYVQAGEDEMYKYERRAQRMIGRYHFKNWTQLKVDRIKDINLFEVDILVFSIYLCFYYIHVWFIPKVTVGNNLADVRPFRMSKGSIFQPFCRQPTLWLYNLYRKVLIVHGCACLGPRHSPYSDMFVCFPIWFLKLRLYGCYHPCFCFIDGPELKDLAESGPTLKKITWLKMTILSRLMMS